MSVSAQSCPVILTAGDLEKPGALGGAVIGLGIPRQPNVKVAFSLSLSVSFSTHLCSQSICVLSQGVSDAVVSAKLQRGNNQAICEVAASAFVYILSTA